MIHSKQAAASSRRGDEQSDGACNMMATWRRRNESNESNQSKLFQKIEKVTARLTDQGKEIERQRLTVACARSSSSSSKRTLDLDLDSRSTVGSRFYRYQYRYRYVHVCRLGSRRMDRSRFDRKEYRIECRLFTRSTTVPVPVLHVDLRSRSNLERSSLASLDLDLDL